MLLIIDSTRSCTEAVTARGSRSGSFDEVLFFDGRARVEAADLRCVPLLILDLDSVRM
jgi:hypothetical protein